MVVRIQRRLERHCFLSWGHKEQRAWSYARRGLLAKYLAGVSVTTEVP